MGMSGAGNCWDGVAEDEDFENILSILDFPMESLEGDGLVGDWDVSQSQFLGPIPSSAPMELSTIPLCKIDTMPSCLLPEPVSHFVGGPELQHVSDSDEASGSHILPQNKFVETKEVVAFQTQSPVSVLESSGSCSMGKSLPIKFNNSNPVRTRSKRARQPAGVSPWLLISPFLTMVSSSKKASNIKKDKEKRKQLPQPVGSNPRKVENMLQLSNHEGAWNAPERPLVTKKCTHCEVTKTPQWREGPLGPKTLCNACGVRYRSGRLYPEYRPAASPTFIPSMHSNSHKKVIEMRNKAKQPMTKSPQPEFFSTNSYLSDDIY